METVFESENIRFVKFTEELVDDYLAMVNDIEHVARFIGERLTPLSMEEELEFIKNQKLMQPYTLSMLEKKTGEFIGNGGFMNVKDGEAEFGIVLTYAKQNDGYGAEAIRSLLDYGWNSIPLKRVYLEVYIDNARAIHLYEKCGFTEFKRTEKDIFMEIFPPFGIDYELLKKLYDVESFVGYNDEEISEMTEGFDTVPAAILAFWKTCGNTAKLFSSSNDPWIDLEYRRKYSWAKRDLEEYFFLLNENQGCFRVAVRRSDMAKENPPVYVTERTGEGAFREVGQAASSVTEFLMGMLLYEAALGGLPYFCEDILWYEDKDIEEIEKVLTIYPYHVENWYSDRIDFYTYSGNEVLFIMKGDTPNGTYAANSEEAFERFDELIGRYGEG